MNGQHQEACPTPQHKYTSTPQKVLNRDFGSLLPCARFLGRDKSRPLYIVIREIHLHGRRDRPEGPEGGYGGETDNSWGWLWICGKPFTEYAISFNETSRKVDFGAES